MKDKNKMKSATKSEAMAATKKKQVSTEVTFLPLNLLFWVQISVHLEGRAEGKCEQFVDQEDK